jgi:hypothetical protein
LARSGRSPVAAICYKSLMILWRLLKVIVALVLLVICVAVIALILSSYGTVGVALGCLLLVGIAVSYLRLRHEVHRKEQTNENSEAAPPLTRHARAFGLVLNLAGLIGLVASAAFAEGAIAALLIAVFAALLIAGFVLRSRGHFAAAVDRAVRLRREMRTKD